MRRLSFFRGALAILAAGLTVTCGDPQSAVPTTPSAPGPLSVEISGPESLAPGQSAQFTASIRLSDGTVKSGAAGTNVVWRSSNTSVLQITSQGLATARQVAGEATISADVPTSSRGTFRRGTKEIVILPPGSYRLTGTVVDAEYPSERLQGARVEVTPGSLVTTTDVNGQYRLYGVPADLTVQVSKEGYVPVSQTLRLTSHATQNFQLPLPGPRLGLAGNYTLAIDVAGSCSNLPSDLQHRRYDAVISQNGIILDVLLTEPRFKVNTTGRGNRFSGRALAAGATFTLEPYYFYYYFYYSVGFGYPNVAERLSDSSILVIQGTAVTSGSAGGLSGTLNGEMTRWDSRFPNQGFFLGSCVSPTLQFSFSPR